MAEDTFNSIRVDLQEIYDHCEERTTYHSRIHKEDLQNQEIVICIDDYRLIHAFANEAASLIADAANYITDTNQTGIEALTANFTEESPNENDSKTILQLMNNEKQTGELLNKGAMDVMQFNVRQMEGFTPLKYTVTQTYIRSAMIEYILFKWYELNKINDAMKNAYDQYEKWLTKVRNNTFAHQKTVNTRKNYRLF